MYRVNHVTVDRADRAQANANRAISRLENDHDHTRLRHGQEDPISTIVGEFCPSIWVEPLTGALRPPILPTSN